MNNSQHANWRRLSEVLRWMRWLVLAIVVLALASKAVALISPKFSKVLNAPYSALPLVTWRFVLWAGIIFDLTLLIVHFCSNKRLVRLFGWLVFSYVSVLMHLYVHFFTETAMCSCIRLDAFGLDLAPKIPELIAFAGGVIAFIAVHADFYLGNREETIDLTKHYLL